MEKKGGAESGNLEQALVHLVHEYNHKTLFIREKTENAKKDALRSGLHVSGLLVDSVNGGVQESFINEKRIEFETRALASTIMRYTKQTNQWLAASHAINSAIKVISLLICQKQKEIGDFENWMKTMDYDCKSISASLCNISKTRH
ncbi:biogenesis of lysosome-related organelles complex 1 subunit 1 isoform X1 [Amborella trichopoda]|uniref:biogenesis of lysosome-related organelles complex 1 subunit 1 isoform X1 n=1 Tax=Amborella trichopoda TaxID=13333 RepID=UPI0005D425DE|nr:biogenesis of lysosome-related organelles complex 1 subunit 1 isoform X1 [Amborella trichopoda]XP_020517399.1 biogenesis of lysosome-related organelles complex 1 subunit 1 isoform X1 [Amborella trichopoda]|eukprot:XP_011629135.1 biogenesis of lysosome-related organelles complex 1 subunit 1 isoform X1 [Amborella trichopoda]